ncbi:hypothetical protein RBB50_012829 [Rhinocladiella similis]
MAEYAVKGPRNRSRAKLVCTNCRARKIKCDAEKLSPGSECSSCRLAKAKCRIDHDTDRRRHGVSHHLLSEMQERIRYLESSIQEKSFDAPSFQQDGQPPTAEESGAHCSPPRHGIANLSTPFQNPPDVISPGFDSNSGWCQISDEANCLESGARDAQLSTISTVPPSAALGPLQVDMANVSNDSEMEDESVRLHRDPETDDIAFYGSTTQLHNLSPVPTNADAIVSIDFDQEMGVNMDSIHLRKSLLSIFFTIQPRAHFVVDEELFRQGRAGVVRSRYYSDFLESAILAVASRHSTSSTVRALGKEYAARAKGQVLSELEHPNIASLQGFLLLSDFEATRGLARVGWAFCIIATGLLVDLGLHVEAARFARIEDMTQVETDFRGKLLLGIFVYATLWSLYLGRPNLISSPVLMAVQRVANARSKNNTLIIWVKLCLQMLGIIEILNTPLAARQQDANSRLVVHEVSLRSTFDGLPPQLAFDDRHIEALDPEAYGVNMQHLGMQVTLLRAMAKSRPSPDDPDPERLERIQTMMHDNAIQIARLMLSYWRTFGLENIVMVMLDNVYLAVVTLISHVARMRQLSRPIENDVRWVRSLYDVVESVEKHYPITRRMRSSLGHVIERKLVADVFPGMVSTISPACMPGCTAGAIAAGPSLSLSSGTQQERLPSASCNGNVSANLDLNFLSNDYVWMHDLAWNMPTFAQNNEDLL